MEFDRRCVVAVFALVLKTFTAPAAAQVGQADTTFGYGGVTIAPFNLGGLDEAFAITTAPDGGYVVVGKAETGGGTCTSLAVAKILATGFYDTSFGPQHNGTVTFQYPGSCSTVGFGVAINNLGPFGWEIAVAANAITPSDASFPFRPIVLMLHSDGTPDELFGDHKPAGYEDVFVARAALGNVVHGYAMTIDSLNRIYVVGDATGSSDTQGFVWRSGSEGAPDGSFGNAGISIVGLGDGNSHIAGLGLASDDTILLGGNTQTGYQAAAKLDAKGSFTTFGSSFGWRFYPETSLVPITAVAIDSANRLLLAGSLPSGFATIRRINTDSSLGSFQSFRYTNNPNETATIESLAIQGDGKILLFGQSNLLFPSVSGLGAGVARLNSDTLLLDATFGSGGTTLLNARADGAEAIIPRAAAISGDGKFLVAGMALNLTTSPTNYDMFVERITTAAANACPGSFTEACLVGSRFKADITWMTSNGQTGNGTLTAFGSDDSAIFYFFDPTNWEVLLKVIDGCALNQKYWVFYSATTNVKFTITVRDTLKAVSKVYTNAQNHVASPVTDTSAFACN